MSCCPDSPWSAEGGKGKGREIQKNTGDAKVSKVPRELANSSPPDLLEGSSRARAGRRERGEGRREARRQQPPVYFSQALF